MLDEELRTCLNDIGEWLARREYSTTQVRRKLEQKGYGPESVEKALRQAAEKGWLSDERFAQAFIHDAMLRHQGPLRIRHQLKERGVCDSLIDEVLPEDAEVWLELARACYHKRFKSTQVADVQDRAKRIRYMNQRGFPAALIKQVMASEHEVWVDGVE